MEDNESKKPIEAFETYIDLHFQVMKAELEIVVLKFRRGRQQEAIADALGICDGTYAFTSVDGTVMVVEFKNYLIVDVKVTEQFEVES